MVADQCLPGTATLSDLPISGHIEIDACMQCGRCRKQCAINLGGLSFSPEALFKGLRIAFHSGAWKRQLVGSVINEDSLWSCTACRSCEERCPMTGEHVERIVGIRRSAITTGMMPKAVAGRFKEHEELLQNTPRLLVANYDPATVYIWPGCHSADKQHSVVLQTLLSLMKSMKIPSAVLDPPACCSGTDRILGNELLLQRAAKTNIEYLQPIKGAIIVTHCPHCYNTLKNEYPGLNNDFELLHHSQFLEQLSDKGLLDSEEKPPIKVTYHDPCFLGRYNSEYAAPRNLLDSIPGLSLVEMKHCQKKSFCCGSGGGGVVTESAMANARQRLRQAESTGADTVITSCPYCRELLIQAATEHNRLIVIADITEVLVQGKPT